MKTIVLIIALSVGSIGYSSENSFLEARNLSGKIDTNKAVHRIQLGEFSNSIPVHIVELMRQIGGVTPVSQKGVSTYYTAAFSSEEDAAKQLPKFQALGFDQAKHVVQYKKAIYDLREFNYLAAGGKVEDNGTVPVIRIWK